MQIFEKRKRVGTIIFLSITIIYFIYFSNTIKNSYSSIEVTRNYNSHDEVTNVKYIYLWNAMFDRTWYLYKNYVAPDDFKKAQCEQTKCVVTTYSSLFPKLSMFDVLLFHGGREWTNSEKALLPIDRNSNQLYVLGILESPTNTWSKLKFDNYFNWTLTYRLDSDVAATYGFVKDKKSNHRIAPDRNVIWKENEDDFFDTQLYEKAKNKTKTIAWFVSHCKTESKRENLVTRLQQYINVDIFGKCGPLKCTRIFNRTDHDPCTVMLDNNYKFYLSFENSLWEDYVTEKLYLAMEIFILPIVYGGANYSYFVPPKSYINANDFVTVEELAKYLLFLSENPLEYLKYFWWKQYYVVLAETPITKFCDLCRRLHKPSNALTEYKVYENVNEWWFKKAKKMLKPLIDF